MERKTRCRLAQSVLLGGLLVSMLASAQPDTLGYARLVRANETGDLDGIHAIAVDPEQRPAIAIAAQAMRAYHSGEHLACGQWLDSLFHLHPQPDARLLATGNKFRAVLAVHIGDMTHGLRLVDDGLALAPADHLPMEHTDLLIAKAELLFESGEDDEALPLLSDAQRIAERAGYARGECLVLMNLGGFKFYQGRLDEAWVEYQNALACANQGGFKPQVRSAINNLAAVAGTQGQHDRALRLFDSLLTHNGRSNLSDRTFLLGQKGYALYMLGSYDLAMQAYAESKALGDSLGDARASTWAVNHISKLQWKTGVRIEAIATRLRALDSYRRMGDAEMVAYSLRGLSEWYETIGDHRAALEHARLLAVVNDSLSQARYGDRTGLAEALFETERKDFRIKEQENELELADLENRRKAQQRNLSIGIAAMLLVAAALLWRSLKHRRKLARQERELHARKVDELMHQNEITALNAMMEGQEKERERLAKDLHDRLGSMLSAIKHQVGALEGEVQQVRQDQNAQYGKVNLLLDEAVSEVRRISHDLVTVTLARFGLQKALEDLCESVRLHGRLEVELSLFGLEQRLERTVEIAPYRITRDW